VRGCLARDTVGSMIKVHVIDGDAVVRLAARRVLERAGFAVSDAKDETSAAPDAPDLVIADLAVVSLAAMRRHHPTAGVLASTSDGVASAEAAMITGSIRKPFTESQLLAAVRLCLARRGATRGPRRRSARPPLRLV
jgi:DNA-binding response OmpR family regulator